MRRVQAGDRGAYSMLYERYSPPVLSYLYRMLGTTAEVEEIGQETFLRAYKFAATYRYPQKFSNWLFTIARNQAINHIRRRKRSPIRSSSELNLEGVEDGTAKAVAERAFAGNTVGALARREEIEKMLGALDELPADQKEVIVLGIFQDMSYGEMEEVTGTKAVTLRSRMFHGLKKLARMLRSEDDD